MGSDNDRRVLLAIILSLAVYYVWVAFFAPPAPVPEAAPETPVAEAPVQPSSTPVAAVPQADARALDEVPARSEKVQTQAFQARLTHESGAIEDVVLSEYTTSPKVHELWTWALGKITGKSEGGWTPYTGGDEPHVLVGSDAAIGVAGAGPLSSDQGYLLEQSGSGWVAMKTLPSGLRITKRYTPGQDPHTLELTVTFENGTGQAVDRLWVGAVDPMGGAGGRFDNAIRPQAVVDGDIEHLLDIADLQQGEVEVFEGPISWVGVGDRYFMASLGLEEPFDGKVQFATLPDGRTGAFMVDGRVLDAGAERTYRFTAFMGPKKLDLLNSLGHEFDEAVEFGIFGFFSRVLLFLLQIFQKGLVNWGLAIIALTVLVKAVFYPLTQKAFVSGKKMQALQPKLKELQEKYKDNKELQSTETMKLFSENGVNPMGGCLPSLIQMPVWFALYTVMLNSVELYDSSFLYLQDLTAADPYGALPIIYAVLIFWQQRLTPMGSLDPAQQRVMKLLPLVFAVWMFVFPSGLVLYFSVNILLTVFQQWLINRTFDAGEQQPPATAT